jgi:hypothetical protein
MSLYYVGPSKSFLDGTNWMKPIEWAYFGRPPNEHYKKNETPNKEGPKKEESASSKRFREQFFMRIV